LAELEAGYEIALRFVFEEKLDCRTIPISQLISDFITIKEGAK